MDNIANSTSPDHYLQYQNTGLFYNTQTVNKIKEQSGNRKSNNPSCQPRTARKDVPLPVLTVAGLNAFHTIVSQMLVAMKSEMPEPRP